MATILLLISLLASLPNQGAKSTLPVEQNAARTPSECSQPEAERDSLIREAEGNHYTIRWVIFVGNEHTSDYVLRRRMINLTEGDVFTRGNLVKSLESVSKLKKIIHPVKLGDVTIRLDRAEKLVDMEICYKEKRRSRRGAAHSSGSRAS
jgi:hypothetical protein